MNTNALNASRSSQYKILLVEDDFSNQKVIQKTLEKEGYAVQIAENGQEALSALQADTYDLIIMDVKMPVMDGVEATRKIRDLDSSIKDIPIIALTAYAMQGEQSKIMQAGMNDYIVKPMDREELKQVLSKYLK